MRERRRDGWKDRVGGKKKKKGREGGEGGRDGRKESKRGRKERRKLHSFPPPRCQI